MTRLSAEDCTRREDGRKTDTRKTKKKDVGPTHGARGQEDQLPGEKSGRPDPVAPQSSEPALGQSTQEEEEEEEEDLLTYILATDTRTHGPSAALSSPALLIHFPPASEIHPPLWTE